MIVSYFLGTTHQISSGVDGDDTPVITGDPVFWFNGLTHLRTHVAHNLWMYGLRRKLETTNHLQAMFLLHAWRWSCGDELLSNGDYLVGIYPL